MKQRRTARCTKSVPLNSYPSGFEYKRDKGILRVGEGEFYPVAPDVWDYSISGRQVVKSWLDYRKLNRSGRKSSPLDEIRPAHWLFTQELLELLWVLEETLHQQPKGAALLEEVCSSTYSQLTELPSPTAEEREPPDNVPAKGLQSSLLP